MATEGSSGKQVLAAISPDAGLFNVQDPTGMDINVLHHNVMPVKTKKDEWCVMQRPTFTTYIDNSVSSGYGRGIMEVNGKILRTTEALYYYGAASSASITGGSGFHTPYMSYMGHFNQAGTDYIIIQNAGSHTGNAPKGNIYYAVDEDTAPVLITDVDAPGANGNPMIRGAPSLDGYLFVCDIFGQIFNSDLDDCTSWSALNFITAERNADPGVYLGRHKDHLVFIGSHSMEFFYNNAAGLASPMSRRNDIFYNIGCQHANTVVDTGDKIYFLGRDAAGTAGIFMLDQFNVNKISSPLMDTICSRVSVTDQGYADSLFEGAVATLVNIPESGQFYVLTLDGATSESQGTYALHLETGLVSKWYTGSSPTFTGTTGAWDTLQLLPLAASANNNGDNPTNTNMYMFYNGASARLETFEDAASTNDLTDIGLTAPFCGFYTAPQDFGTNERKRQTCLRVLHYPSVDDSIDPSNATIAWKNLDTLEAGGFDRDSFPVGRAVDLSKAVARLYRGGMFRNRMYEVELTPNKRQIIKGLELDLDLLRG